MVLNNDIIDLIQNGTLFTDKTDKNGKVTYRNLTKDVTYGFYASKSNLKSHIKKDLPGTPGITTENTDEKHQQSHHPHR